MLLLPAARRMSIRTTSGLSAAARSRFDCRRCHSTDHVTELRYEHGKMHGNNGIVFDDKSAH